MSDTTSNAVGVAFGAPRYDPPPPFNAGVAYPEYPHGDALEPSGNAVYDTVRSALHLLGADAEHYGTTAWNPMRSLIRPGQTVVVKPNLVRNFRDSSPDHADCVVVDGSVLRAVVDYVYIALEGRGRIVIADAPHNDCDFEAVRAIARLDAIVDFYARTHQFTVEVIDLRPECATKVDGVIVDHRRLPGDPAGYVRVDLGDRSMFQEIGDLCQLLYGSEYDRRELVSHHTGGRHEYLISGTVLSADCVVSVPKLKTHKKTGLTATLKNLVGINGNKNWLPHHREGTPADGGDQFADSTWFRRSEQLAVAAFKRVFPWLGPFRAVLAAPIKAMGKGVFGDTSVDTIRSGNWYGNDTTWRMVHDLNRILLYADRTGRLHQTPQRTFLSLVDGIVGGDGNGPMDPKPKPSGVVLAGWNPVAVDMACARVMGFDYHTLPVLWRALDAHPLPLMHGGAESVRLVSNAAAFDGRLQEVTGSLDFLPHFGWRGHIELDRENRASRRLA